VKSCADIAVGGSENLEVMAEARNYNAFLVQKVRNAMAGRHRILDFGAGRGTFALPLREHGHEVVCVEPEPTLRLLLDEFGLQAYLTLEEVPLKGLDGIYTINVLEHIEADEAVLGQLHDRLAEGGRLFIYVPAFQLLYSSMDRRIGHVRRYRLSDLTTKCERAGFTVEKAGYCDSLGFPATLLYKLIGGRDGVINRRGLILYDRAIFPVSRLIDSVTGKLFGKNVWVIGSRR
jgi:SAM-dependent methyltransferase